MSTATPTAPTAEFLITKEHRRFTEFADAVRHDRYISSRNAWPIRDCHGRCRARRDRVVAVGRLA